MFVQPSQVWFRFIHSNFLIYNMCWEDVEIDLNLLQLTPQSRVFTITSAGDNVLTYALTGVSSVHSADINPRQTFLLELKLALIKYNHYDLFYECFALGKSANLLKVYSSIRPLLSAEAASFWDTHLHYFNPEGRGLFFHGGSGYFARFLNHLIERKKLRPIITSIVSEPSKARREELFYSISKQLWNGKEAHFWKNSLVLGLAGIPVAQRRAIGDLDRFIQEVLHSIFVKQMAGKNPYWAQYLNLEVAPEDQLPYLRAENFPKLRQTINRLEFATKSVFDFLNTTPHTFTHFVLLDHMDWMTEHNRDLLVKQWELLFQKAAPNAKVLFRTAHHNVHFLPKFVKDKLVITKVDEHWLQHHDRVGTYTGTYIGTVA